MGLFNINDWDATADDVSDVDLTSMFEGVIVKGDTEHIAEPKNVKNVQNMSGTDLFAAYTQTSEEGVSDDADKVATTSDEDDNVWGNDFEATDSEFETNDEFNNSDDSDCESKTNTTDSDIEAEDIEDDSSEDIYADEEVAEDSVTEEDDIYDSDEEEVAEDEDIYDTDDEATDADDAYADSDTEVGYDDSETEAIYDTDNDVSDSEVEDEDISDSETSETEPEEDAYADSEPEDEDVTDIYDTDEDVTDSETESQHNVVVLDNATMDSESFETEDTEFDDSNNESTVSTPVAPVSTTATASKNKVVVDIKAKSTPAKLIKGGTSKQKSVVCSRPTSGVSEPVVRETKTKDYKILSEDLRGASIVYKVCSLIYPK